MKNYAGELYDLKGSVCDVNKNYKSSGIGGASEDLVWKIERET
jgi:hypothetical protein